MQKTITQIEINDEFCVLLTDDDFREKSTIKVLQIPILNRDIFSSTPMSKILKMQDKQNKLGEKSLALQRLVVNDESSVITTKNTHDEGETLPTEAFDEYFKNTAVNIKVISYAPKVFHFIRKIDGLEEQQILNSIDPKNNRFQMFKVNRKNETDFRRIYFYTYDREFIIKSISNSEVIKLCQTMKTMVKYLKKEKSQSLLSRIYGLYKVSLNGIKDINLCIERNCVQAKPNNRLLQVFDLKGNGWGMEKLQIDIEEVRNERYQSVLATD